MRGPSSLLAASSLVRCHLSRTRWRSHQANVCVVELVQVQIELDIGKLPPRRNLDILVHKDSLTIARSMIDIDVDIELPLVGDDAGIEEGRGGDLIPHITRTRKDRKSVV